MPSHRVHCYVDRMYFGKSYSKIHKAMDAPSLFFGRKHRIFYHDAVSAISIARYYYPNDPNAITSALLHIDVDNLCSQDITYWRYLEFMAQRESQRRKAGFRKRKRKSGVRRRKKQETPAEKLLYDTCEKLIEARRLMELLYSRYYYM
jgi:hypothetical protein